MERNSEYNMKDRKKCLDMPERSMLTAALPKILSW